MKITTQLRVRFCETDQQGVVHHGQYLEYFEVARIEFFREMGFEIRQFEEQKLDLAVVAVTVQYKRPARFDDILDLAVAVEHIGTASFGLAYEIRKDSQILTTGTTRLACIKPNGKPSRIPENFLEALRELDVEPASSESERS